ncbi:DinB family protein [Solimicrobium silvestre]|uniref:DinB family n=1 Tax=Solimicrobium silvestre TaxID=2099400 RepID=A0A2S9GYI2_9BURK|nr:DinB family protein [Solimicrobium silvestre]PRC92771.1 hypothetical protein S2091_2501 [Solimicrobium silvestre]
MSTLTLLHTLFEYQAWANGEFLEKMKSFDAELHNDRRHTAMRLINHTCIVSQIFAAHLTGANHNLTTDNPIDTPSLEDLREAVAASDRWYLTYLENLTPDQLSESIPFVFTDGDKGYMSREEMLTHVVVHHGYHRGEVGRIMGQISLPIPWDTYAVYLHQTEPLRRLKT